MEYRCEDYEEKCGKSISPAEISDLYIETDHGGCVLFAGSLFCAGKSIAGVVDGSVLYTSDRECGFLAGADYHSAKIKYRHRFVKNDTIFLL